MRRTLILLKFARKKRWNDYDVNILRHFSAQNYFLMKKLKWEEWKTQNVHKKLKQLTVSTVHTKPFQRVKKLSMKRLNISNSTPRRQWNGREKKGKRQRKAKEWDSETAKQHEINIIIIIIMKYCNNTGTHISHISHSNSFTEGVLLFYSSRSFRKSTTSQEWYRSEKRKVPQLIFWHWKQFTFQ